HGWRRTEVPSHRLAPLREAGAWDLANRLERGGGLLVIADPGHLCLLADVPLVADGVQRRRRRRRSGRSGSITTPAYPPGSARAPGTVSRQWSELADAARANLPHSAHLPVSGRCDQDPFLSFGSRASRMPSPSRLSASTVTRIARPGKIATCGASWM